MDDVISRQQAIDDIWTVSPLACLDRKWVDRWLKQLPPAQPTFDARDTQYNLPIGTDLISRAEALEWCLEGLNNMPSAQPEIIKCMECKYYEASIAGNPWGVCCHKDWVANNIGHNVDETGWCYRAERREVTA